MSKVHTPDDKTVQLSCPKCGGTRFGVGLSPFSFDAMRIRARVLMNPVAFAVGVAKTIKNEFLDNIRTAHLKKCRSCKTLILFCPHCDKATMLPSIPRFGDLFTCWDCHQTFSWHEGEVPKHLEDS